MATTRGEPEPVIPRITRVQTIARSVIAGHEQGAVRRIILYSVMFATMGVAFYLPFVLVVALVCGILLLATDGEV